MFLQNPENSRICSQRKRESRNIAVFSKQHCSYFCYCIYINESTKSRNELHITRNHSRTAPHRTKRCLRVWKISVKRSEINFIIMNDNCRLHQAWLADISLTTKGSNELFLNISFDQHNLNSKCLDMLHKSLLPTYCRHNLFDSWK